MLRRNLPPHGKMVHRPGKNQAVHPTKKASIVKIINRNASESPLLKLASEIREKIWKAAIGDRTIHIKHFSAEQLETLQRHLTYPEATEPNGAFRHIECTATTTENEAHIASKTQSTVVPAGEDPAFYVQSYKSRHYNCYQLENGDHGKQAWISLFEQGDYLIDKKDRITTCTMLGTCRQIYEEAYRILWSSNAFSFDDPYSLREFLGSLTLSQKRHLTTLQICERLEQIPGIGDFDWADTFESSSKKKVLALLSGLRSFHLRLEQRIDTQDAFNSAFNEDAFNSAFNSHISQWDWLSSLSTPWLVLRSAPLANVTVIIGDKQSFMQRHGLMDIRCTVQRKSEIADKIRNNIIDDDKVAKARQDIKNKRAFQKERRGQLKQEKVQDEVKKQAVEKQARDILKHEDHPFEEITPAQFNVISRIYKSYESIYDEPYEVEHVRAARLLEKLGQQRQEALRGALLSQKASLSSSQAVMNRDSDETQPPSQPHRNITNGSQEPPQSYYSVNYQLDDFSRSSYLQPRNRYHVRGLPAQDFGPTQQTFRDPSSTRYHPYAVPVRITYAHPAAHMPGAATTTNRPQSYPGNSRIMRHDTGYATSAASMPHVAYAGTNEQGIGPGDHYPETILPSRITYAHPAAHMPGAATTNRPQAYPGNSHIMGHDTGDAIPAASVPHVTYAGTNEHGIGPGYRYLEASRRSQVFAWLEDVEVQEDMEGQGYSMDPDFMM